MLSINDYFYVTNPDALWHFTYKMGQTNIIDKEGKLVGSQGCVYWQDGSWNRSVFSGYEVAFVPFKGKNPGKAEPFLTGFIKNEEKKEVYGRPVVLLYAQTDRY